MKELSMQEYVALVKKLEKINAPKLAIMQAKIDALWSDYEKFYEDEKGIA